MGVVRMECGYYSRAATITFKVWQEGATIRDMRLETGTLPVVDL